jgi:predicted RNA-binding Zn-ribbon protein involved in translation (DUF1610 family)
MATAKNATRRQARESKTTKPTAAEHAAAVQVMLDGDQFAAVAAGHLCEIKSGLPIVGTANPLPCPFCGQKDIHLAFNAGVTAAHVECHVCGTEGPYSCIDGTAYAMAIEASRLWNTRKGGGS